MDRWMEICPYIEPSCHDGDRVRNQRLLFKTYCNLYLFTAFAHDAMGRRIDPSWGEPIELFLVPASAPRLV